ncbi:MAG TPA: type I glutamate--ammonia ligase, partial [Candidatus Aminicenantes bacterium]|nr:type I glutamate--ammonia ligase [Candidatus Aminicenantes bacterium]
YHQYLVKGGKNAFYQAGKYANLNETALFYIGGILSHLNSLVGITNPSTNSYKRLIPNFEAPTGINFGIGNRNSAIRIPGYVAREDETRVEFRTPDATCNPYLALSATLMAGIDGIVEKVDPVAKGYGPADPKKKYKEIEGNLQQALANLKKDKGFLLRDGVFSEVLVDKYIADRSKDCVEVSLYPTPAEYLYYFDI